MQLGPNRRDDSTRLGISIELEQGRTFQFLGAEVKLTIRGSTRTVALDRIRSGFKAESGLFSMYSVPFVHYEPTALLAGGDRFSKLPPPVGPKDRFQESILVGLGYVPTFQIELPALRANGAIQHMSPITFDYKEVKFVQCIQ